MPQRIQRRRTKGWRMPEGAIYVGRPSRWGNPIRIVAQHASGPFDLERDGAGFIGQHTGIESARRAATMRYRNLVMLDLTPVSLDDIRAELRGHDLACWCPLPEPGQPDHCHAAVLLSLANGGA